MQHTAVFGATVDQWTALSAIGSFGAAIGTLIAAAVAVYAPYLIKRLDSEKEASDLVTRLDEAIKNIKVSLRTYDRARVCFDNTDSSGLLLANAEGRGLAETLRVLAKPDMLPADVLVCALAAANTLDAIDRANTKARVDFMGGHADMVSARALAEVARGRLLELEARSAPALSDDR